MIFFTPSYYRICTLHFKKKNLATDGSVEISRVDIFSMQFVLPGERSTKGTHSVVAVIFKF